MSGVTGRRLSIVARLDPETRRLAAQQQTSPAPSSSQGARPPRTVGRTEGAGLEDAVWRKGSRSNGNGGNNCVEVALLDTVVAVRDSKCPGGRSLLFSPADWVKFVNDAKSGEFDVNG